MKILITGGNQAKALKLLKAFPAHFILFADYGDVAAMSTPNYAFTTLGELNPESIAHILLNFCMTESIDSIVPLHDFEVIPLAKSAVLFGEYGIEVLLPSQDDLATYLQEDKKPYSQIAVFIQGTCIFSTSKTIPESPAKTLNGVFSYEEGGTDFKLFTLS